MDQIRTIRIVLASFMLLGSLLLGGWLDDRISIKWFSNLENLTALGGIVAASIVPAGFVIGGMTIAVLWLCHKCTPDHWDRFELSLSEGAWTRIWRDCGFRYGRTNKNTRIWGATIWIRSRVLRQVHEISDRRYQAAAGHLSACTAIVISWPVGAFVLRFCSIWLWIALSGLVAALFLFLAFVTRSEASELLEILAY